MACSICKGKGYVECPKCNGKGSTPKFMGGSNKCSHCGGTGKVTCNHR